MHSGAEQTHAMEAVTTTFVREPGLNLADTDVSDIHRATREAVAPVRILAVGLKYPKKAPSAKENILPVVGGNSKKSVVRRLPGTDEI